MLPKSGEQTMSYEHIALSSLRTNRSNDRHGELENETAAMAWLFNNLEQHMRNLAKDIVETGGIYEPPLVASEDDHFVVFDGNRRITCLKLLATPRRAPTVDLQEFFTELRAKWSGDFPTHLHCQVETDRDRIDDILFRRHTGSQAGVGQSTWDDRMKSNFVARTGKDSGFNVADEIERRLTAAGMLPRRKIPRSNLNRLLSSDTLRNRVGFTVSRGKLSFTHQEETVLHAMRRIADDLANGRVVLGDIWDIDSKRAYLDRLDEEHALPTSEHRLKKPEPATVAQATVKPRAPPASPTKRTTLIPNKVYAIEWPGRLQRHHAIWEELQFRLYLSEHPNAISVLFRVLFELSIENYLLHTKLNSVRPNDNLATRALRIAEDLQSKNKISEKYLQTMRKFPQYDALVSADTLNRYVHSPTFAPSPEHLTAIWDSLADFVVQCLQVSPTQP
jgi:hypothetical protein